MNKSKIKNAAIGLLLFINLFLLSNLMITRATTGNIPALARESFVTILADHNITIDEKQVPARYEKRPTVTVDFYNIDELRDIFLDSYTEYISDGQSVSATSDDKKIAVAGKSFEYTTLHEKVEKDGKRIIKALKKQGLSVEGAYFDKADGLVKVMIDNALVEGVYLDVYLNKKGEIAYVKGEWPKVKVEENNNRTSLVSAVSDIISKIPQNSVIDKVEKVYTPNKTEQSSVCLPAWRVYVGDKYYTVQG